jgi:hypothetical protein
MRGRERVTVTKILRESFDYPVDEQLIVAVLRDSFNSILVRFPPHYLAAENLSLPTSIKMRRK